MAFEEFIIGKRERMVWAVETSFGSGATIGSGEVVGLNCQIQSPDWRQGYQEKLTAGADSLVIQGRVKGPKTLPYTMSFTPVSWKWLKYLMSVADSDDGGVKTHTFTVNNSITSYKLEWAKRHTTPHVVTTIGNFVKSAAISWRKATGAGTEGFITVALSCVAQDDSLGSTVTGGISNISKEGFQYRMVKVIIDGTEFKEVNNGDMTISLGINEADSRYCSTTYDNLIGEPIPGIFRISGRYNITLKDSDLAVLWAAGTAVSGTCSLLFDRDGTGDDQLLATFSNFYILTAIAGTKLEGATTVDIVWSADSFTSLIARDDITTY